MAKYKCSVCGWVYDPETGDPDGGIAPAHHLRKYRMAGNVPYAGQQKANSKRYSELIISEIIGFRRYSIW